MGGEYRDWHDNLDDIRREHGQNGGVSGHQRRTQATRTEVYTNTIDGCAWLALGGVIGRQRTAKDGHVGFKCIYLSRCYVLGVFFCCGENYFTFYRLYLRKRPMPIFKDFSAPILTTPQKGAPVFKTRPFSSIYLEHASSSRKKRDWALPPNFPVKYFAAAKEQQARASM